MRSAVCGALLCLFVVASCAGDEQSEKRSVEQTTQETKPAGIGALTKRELRWLQRLRSWEASYVTASSDVNDAYTAVIAGDKKLGHLRRAVRPLVTCARSLRRKMREPPTVRLEPGFELLLEACEQERRSGQALVQAFTSERNATGDGNDAQVKSGELFQRAHDRFDSLLLANRPLPTARGPSTASRIEPRLARAVSGVAIRPVEIRCWSKRDWRATSKEYRAYTGTRFEVAGFANPTKFRANIAPDYCARLVRFTYKRWRPADGDELIDAAEAVAVLAHETEHLSNPAGSEAETECHGMQDIRQVAVKLGASRSYAARLAETYWKEVYPYAPPGYRTEICLNGGPLDIDPESDVWP